MKHSDKSHYLFFCLHFYLYIIFFCITTVELWKKFSFTLFCTNTQNIAKKYSMTSFCLFPPFLYKCCVESSVNLAAYSFSTFLYSTIKHFVCLNAVSQAVSPSSGLQWLTIVEISCRTSAGTSDSIWALLRTPAWSTHLALLKKHFTKHCTVASTGSILSKSRLWSCVNCLAVTLNWSLHSFSASSSSVVGFLKRLIEREFDCPEIIPGGCF